MASADIVAAPHRSRIVAGVVATAFFMQMLDGTIIATSLPAMATEFGTDAVTMSIGFTVYMLTMAVFIPPAAWVADRFGARNVFAFSIILFTVASLACALSNSLAAFVVARAVQGIGAALMTPVGRMIVLRGAPKSELVRVTATITWPALFAPVIGPLLGGWITTHFGWEWNFLINIPLGGAGTLLVMAYVPLDEAQPRRPFDVIGFLATAGGLAALLAGLEAFVAGHGIALPLALVATGLAAGAFAVRHLRSTAVPLLDLGILKVPSFTLAAVGSGTLGRLSINATPFLLPLMFQVGFGLSAVEAGSLLLIYFLGNLSAKLFTTPLLRRIGFRNTLVFNGTLAAASIAAFALVDARTAAVPLYALLLFAGLTRSTQFTSLNTIAFADVEPAQRGAATTLASMMQQIAMVLGVAIAVAVVRISQTARGAGESSALTGDFHWAFLVVGATGAISALRFTALRRDAGSEVSGHRRP